MDGQNILHQTKRVAFASLIVSLFALRACRVLKTAALGLVAASALAGCAGLPKLESPPVPSRAIAASADNPLGKLAQQLQPSPEASGMRLLPLGTFSLDARAQLTRRAQVSLDVQYYHFANDDTGRLLLRNLRDAAMRGVRVRLLIDDLYTTGADALFLGFAAHPNVEVRLYNPFTAARSAGPIGRFLAAPLDWGRVNHRMHNKLFIADGAFGVIGGRNVANEYYLRKDSDNFIDVDALITGQVLPALQSQFDRYWNSEVVVPLQAVARSPLSAQALRDGFDSATHEDETPPPMNMAERDVLGYAPVGPDMDSGKLKLIWGRAQAFADHPSKPFQGAAGGELMMSSVTYSVLQAMAQAQSEVLASSPYFIPGARGLALFGTLRQRGVKVGVLTNSLASTDEPVVHLAYARYREALLEQGVELYELSQRRVKDNMRMFLFGASLGRLHAKTVVIDQRLTYIGSMNLDPRSATINTELGVFIESPELAAEMTQLIDIDRLHSAYRLRLSAGGGCCEWVVPDSDDKTVITLEPDSAWWMRWIGSLLQPVTPEDQL